MTMKKTKPVFNVIYEQWSKENKIVFANFFEFGQWQTIKTRLKKVKSKFLKLKDADWSKISKEIENETFNKPEEGQYHRGTLVEEIVDRVLESECRYYFWCKCEYEVVIQSWPSGKSEKKIDIFEQLHANWPVFRSIVFKEIGL